MIYVLYIAHGTGIDLSEGVEDKIRFNGNLFGTNAALTRNCARGGEVTTSA